MSVASVGYKLTIDLGPEEAKAFDRVAELLATTTPSATVAALIAECDIGERAMANPITRFGIAARRAFGRSPTNQEQGAGA